MTEEHSVENDAPCCNVTEPDGIPCDGTMRAGWPVFTCDTCRAQCGALAHPAHDIPPGTCGICGGALAKVGTSRCYEAHGVLPPGDSAPRT